MTELGLEPTCHEILTSYPTGHAASQQVSHSTKLLLYPNLSYTLNTQQVFRAGDTGAVVAQQAKEMSIP